MGRNTYEGERQLAAESLACDNINNSHRDPSFPKADSVKFYAKVLHISFFSSEESLFYWLQN